MFLLPKSHREAAFGMLTILCIFVPFVGCIGGCNNPPLVPTPVEVEIQAPPINDDETILAIEIAEELGSNPTPDVTPTPSVKPGDRCPECKGTGQFDGDKDGKVDGPCHHCNADGKVDEGDPILSGGKEHSILVPPISRAEFDRVTETVENFVKSWTQSSTNILQEIKDSATAYEQLQARLNEEAAKTSALVDSLSKAEDQITELKKQVEVLSSSQEKAKPITQTQPVQQQGRWVQVTRQICPRLGPCQNVTQWEWVPNGQ